jgi:hypothetical protein
MRAKSPAARLLNCRFLVSHIPWDTRHLGLRDSCTAPTREDSSLPNAVPRARGCARMWRCSTGSEGDPVRGAAGSRWRSTAELHGVCCSWHFSADPNYA